MDVALHVGMMFEADGGLCCVCDAMLGCIWILTCSEVCLTVSGLCYLSIHVGAWAFNLRFSIPV